MEGAPKLRSKTHRLLQRINIDILQAVIPNSEMHSLGLLRSEELSLKSLPKENSQSHSSPCTSQALTTPLGQSLTPQSPPTKHPRSSQRAPNPMITGWRSLACSSRTDSQALCLLGGSGEAEHEHEQSYEAYALEGCSVCFAGCEGFGAFARCGLLSNPSSAILFYLVSAVVAVDSTCRRINEVNVLS